MQVKENRKKLSILKIDKIGFAVIDEDYFNNSAIVFLQEKEFSMIKIFWKKSISLSLVLVIAAFFVAPWNSILSQATGVKVYNAPIVYYNANYNSDRTCNITISLSTDTIGKGTIVTVKGMPAEYTYTENDYRVIFYEYTDSSEEYFSYSLYGNPNIELNPIVYANNTINYRIKNDVSRITIGFGGYADAGEGTYIDYTIYKDGTIEQEQHLFNINDEYNDLEDIGYISWEEYVLSKFDLNSSVFNAYAYYLNNPDLASLYGANPQDLYNHWVNRGKTEGRVAI